MQPQLLLASKSPRRRQLMKQMSVPFDVICVEVPELPQRGELPWDYVVRLASDKAQAGLQARPQHPV